jgi:hypothetical protein
MGFIFIRFIFLSLTIRTFTKRLKFGKNHPIVLAVGQIGNLSYNSTNQKGTLVARIS